MNKFRTFERHSGLLAFALSGLVYSTAVLLVFFPAQRTDIEQRPAMGPKAVNLSFAQMELRAAAAQPAPPEPVPPPPEPADVAPKEIQKIPEPEPEASRPEEMKTEQPPAMAQAAQTVQEAFAPETPVEAAETLPGETAAIDWRALAVARLRAMIEREKYYPPAAQKAGYTGRVSVLIRLEPDGTIAGFEVKERRGHPLLGRAVETTMGKIQGRNIGLTLPERFEMLLPIDFELN